MSIGPSIGLSAERPQQALSALFYERGFKDGFLDRHMRPPAPEFGEAGMQAYRRGLRIGRRERRKVSA